MIARYSRLEFAALWTDAARFNTWLEVELSACRAMEARKLVPSGIADEVSKKVDGKLDPVRILEIEQTCKHDVIAFLTHVEELAQEPARWLHLGMTSSDVLDTSLALTCQRALSKIEEGLDQALGALKQKAIEFKNTPCIGRSHGIHAEPTTAGLVFARYHAELERAKVRVVKARATISFGKIAGAVGTYGNLSPDIEKDALDALGLKAETVSSQVVARDRHAEMLNALAFVGAAAEQIAIGVRHWQRTEVGEAEEGFGKGQKGSSAMPHKKNPILSENLTGLARLLRGYAGTAFENIALWHERDISHSSVERVALPDATILTDFLLGRLCRLVEGLVVHPDKMMSNLEITGGLCFSGTVLLELVRKGLPRQKAYEFVQKCALLAHEGKGDFRGNLEGHNEIANFLSKEEIEKCFSLSHHLRHVDAIFARAFPE